MVACDRLPGSCRDHSAWYPNHPVAQESYPDKQPTRSVKSLFLLSEALAVGGAALLFIVLLSIIFYGQVPGVYFPLMFALTVVQLAGARRMVNAIETNLSDELMNAES